MHQADMSFPYLTSRFDYDTVWIRVLVLLSNLLTSPMRSDNLSTEITQLHLAPRGQGRNKSGNSIGISNP